MVGTETAMVGTEAATVVVADVEGADVRRNLMESE
jgi:hypothetical protein